MAFDNSQSATNKRAIVIGGSLAGLFAARVLADHFAQVLVIERDPQPDSPTPRKGVPQGNHIHGMLRSGENALKALFPGLNEELLAAGSVLVDFSTEFTWFQHGSWKLRNESGFTSSIQSRPLREFAIRKRVQAFKNISFEYGCAVEELLTSADATRITGVRLQRAEGTGSEELLADLIVDATGRGSKTPQWLPKLGYEKAPETIVKMDLSYSSRYFEAPANYQRDWKSFAVSQLAPGITRGAAIFPVEDNRWLITVQGYSGDHAPVTNEDFVEFTRTFAVPDMYNVVKTLKPLTDVKAYSVPMAIRRHYDKLKRFPEGYIVLGDAFCAFDPVFGQGMSVAALEALVLRDMLIQEGGAGVERFPHRFHKRIAQTVNAPWLLSTSEDFRFPKTEGARPFWMPFLHWYSGHVFELSATDKEAYVAFRDVLHLLIPPTAFFKPSLVAKVLVHALTGRHPQPVPESIQESVI